MCHGVAITFSKAVQRKMYKWMDRFQFGFSITVLCYFLQLLLDGQQL
jgi:hypothetical protein